MSNDDIYYSVKGKRSLSQFLTHELLYDYANGDLDPERSLAVEKSLEQSAEARRDLVSIQASIRYLDRLSAISVTDEVVQSLKKSTGYIPTLVQKSKFETWPVGLKWGLEALVVVFAIMVVLSVTPWDKVLDFGDNLNRNEIILAEIERAPRVTEPVAEGPPEFVDEGVKEPGKESSEPEVVAAAPPKAPLDPAPKVVEVVKTPPAKVVSIQDVAGKSNHPAPESGGFLYRGSIEVTNIDVVGPKITEKIDEMGGRKAGSVELGWKRTPDSIYYHFTIPEAKYRDLLSFLDTYGKAKIIKEKHPRVMRDGIIRLIINVDEAKQ